jgi:membrane protein implicated in regulation of membrane protease activity
MTKGYKFVSYLETIVAIIIGALPLLLFGFSTSTIVFFLVILLLSAVNLRWAFYKVKREREAYMESQCPYKVESRNESRTTRA